MALRFTSPFTASRRQVATYLLGVALFSISFLVFLNASVSFVITNRIHQRGRVGDAVGTLGFADELVALVACPIWGLTSDALGVRTVCVLGYAIVGISLFVFVQAQNVFPQLLLARILFSVGGAATATMVTAILPCMTAGHTEDARPAQAVPAETLIQAGNGSEARPSAGAADATSIFTPPESHSRPLASRAQPVPRTTKAASSQVAGLVGMFTGLGALVALGAFLPLPARFEEGGSTPSAAIAQSYYLVGAIALAVSAACGLGLAGLPGEQGKGLMASMQRPARNGSAPRSLPHRPTSPPALGLAAAALRLGFTEVPIGLAYLGGFVARASSVAISLFIPLYVNAYFISSGRCGGRRHSDPQDIKAECHHAYVLASILSGVSQLAALVCAPLYGYLGGRFVRFNIPLLLAAGAGIAGYVALANIPNPDFREAGGAIFLVMVLIGFSQIGSIVCSLGLLGRGIQGDDGLEKRGAAAAAAAADATGTPEEGHQDDPLLRAVEENDRSPLLPSHLQRLSAGPGSRAHIKGSIAGMYSLAGGAGILLLTKLGGVLFDRLGYQAPFYMMAVYNAVLLAAGVACAVGQEARRSRLS